MQLPVPVKDFLYYDGVKTVYGDRLALYKQLLIRTRGKPNELQNKIFAVKADETDIEKLMESWEADEQLIALVRELFQMVDFDRLTNQGARDEHCWAVWTAFVESMDEEKKNPETLVTSSAPTESPAASSPPGASTSA